MKEYLEGVKVRKNVSLLEASHHSCHKHQSFILNIATLKCVVCDSSPYKVVSASVVWQYLKLCCVTYIYSVYQVCLCVFVCVSIRV